MTAVLAIWVTPVASGLSMVTAKLALPPLPAARLPMVRVHRLPGLLSGAQIQPALLAPGLNTLSAGTVSVMTTPVASWLPALL